MKVGDDVAARKRCEIGNRHREGFRHRPADLDHGIGRHRGRRFVEMRAETWEPVESDLARRKFHACRCHSKSLPASTNRSLSGFRISRTVETASSRISNAATKSMLPSRRPMMPGSLLTVAAVTASRS